MIRIKSTKQKQIALAIIFFLLGGLASWLWLAYAAATTATAAAPASNQNAQPIRLGKKGLVNPLLEYTTADNQFSEITSFSNQLNGRVNAEIQNGNATDVAIFFQDLNSGRWAGVNASKKFSPASLLKVPVMMTYLKLAEADPEILQKSVFYDGSFDENAIEDIKPLKAIQPGYSYTVEELLHFMVGYSDNNADELLFTTGVTTDQFNKTYTDLGMSIPTSTQDFLSPRLYSRFFRVLYNSTYLGQAMSQKALELLAVSDFPQGLTAGVPENTTVAQKFGEHDFVGSTQKELHDCGIIYHPDRPYVLCVMTKGNDFTKLTSAIRDVSRTVWDSVPSLQL